MGAYFILAQMINDLDAFRRNRITVAILPLKKYGVKRLSHKLTQPPWSMPQRKPRCRSYFRHERGSSPSRLTCNKNQQKKFGTL